jgi:catechol 2,3-dioxygenase-like lactoylglutathione lyase family enzyme
MSFDRDDNTTDIARRRVLQGSAGLALALGARGALHAQAPDADLVARQLPLDAVGLEHIGTVVPDVTSAATFFSSVFNPEIYKEQAPPLRYYVTLDPGYIAFGSREGETEAFIDHDCVMAEQYERAAMAERLAREGLPAGRFGIIGDPDGLGLQLLPIGGLAASTEHAGRLVDTKPIVRPRGLHRVLRYVSDLEESVAFYRKFFGAELDIEVDGAPSAVWFAVGPTRFGVAAAPRGEAPRIDRFCVNVAAGGFEFEAAAEALEALGAAVVTASPDRVHFRSPEGIGVELRPVDPARIWGRT